MSANLETSAVTKGLEKISFHSNLKERQYQRMFKLPHNCTHLTNWSWSSDTLATWCEELTHLKRPCCWERLKEGEGDDRGWDGWMASLTRWSWVWARSGSWWWTGKPGVLQSMGLQRVGHDQATELNFTWCVLFPRSTYKLLRSQEWPH